VYRDVPALREGEYLPGFSEMISYACQEWGRAIESDDESQYDLVGGNELDLEALRVRLGA
jgi:hypothetical protein